MILARVIWKTVFFMVLIAGAAAWTESNISFKKDEPKLRVWVFEPFTSQTRKEMERTLSKALSHLEITIFTRFRDFRNALSKGPLPDAVLTRPVVLESFPSLSLEVVLKGSAGGSSTEPFVFVANKSLDQKDRLVLGAVDMMGKKETEAWLTKVLPEKCFEMKPVSRLEDLRALLVFNYVDAIVVPIRDVAWFRSKTEQDLTVHNALFQVHLPIMAVSSDSSARILLMLDQGVFKDLDLGVDNLVSSPDSDASGDSVPKQSPLNNTDQ